LARMSQGKMSLFASKEEYTKHMIDWLGPFLGIVLVDLVLSGDNAVVIGAAAAALPRRQRLTAIVVGGGGAVILRIFFALAAGILLQLPYLGVVGGLILLVIAIRLLADQSTIRCHSKHKTPSLAEEQTNPDIVAPKSDSMGLFTSICTILIADLMMSLDNVLAIAGLAKGNPLLLVAGLVLSITILLTGSALVAVLIARLPWLLDIACLIVGWTAANIFLSDDTLQPFFQQFPWVNIVTYVIVTLIVLVIDVYLQKRARKSSRRELG
jgi:YjbE family integral membrane protein